MNAPLTRRLFIASSLSAAGGLVIAVAAPEVAAALPIGPDPWSSEILKHDPGEINAFVVVEPDNSILICIAKSEMGQGVMTSLAMIVAEELECDMAKVRVEYASANRNLIDSGPYQRMGTGGSSLARRSRVFLQQAGASARARLIAAAAKRWGVAPAACVARAGAVVHDPSGRTALYGELAADAAKIALGAEPAIKTPDQFKLMGTRAARLDTPVKVTGEAKFGIDTRLPEMVYAAVANCPVFGGKLKSYDAAAIKNRRGVIAVVPVEGGVAVVANRFWRAREALAAMHVAWDFGAAASSNSDQFRAQYRAALNGPVVNAVDRGDAKTAFAKAARHVDVLCEAPHLAHAPMEPLNATAHWRPDRLDVWLGTQDADGALTLAAEAGGLDPRNVYVHNCYLGGGFGRRAVNDE
jgi:isoquinoline 1-oxidoreductase beta subunit